MELKSNGELEVSLGKENTWFPKRLIGDTTYISGIEVFDGIIDKNQSTFDVPFLVNLFVRPNGLQIEMAKLFKFYSVGIRNEEIQEISLEDREQILEQKDKSVIGRAIAGGLVAGPVGALVGGMSGLETKEVKVKMPDLLLSIKVSVQDTPILLACKFKKRKTIDEFLNKHFNGVYSRS